MGPIIGQLGNERGFILGITMLILGIFTVLAVSMTVFCTTELQIASNDKFYKIAFYGAEAGRSYVPENSFLYGVDNIDKDVALNFPNNDAPSETQAMGPHQAFNGTVQYLGPSTPPRGSGYEVGIFKAHRYQMTSNGFGPHRSQSRVEAGFYRIGF